VLDFDGLLRFAVEHGASDIHVKVGARPRLRIDGRLREAPFDTVEPADTERVVMAIMPKGRAETFVRTHEADFMYSIAGLGRFRASAFRQRSWAGLVLRRVLPGIPGFEALGLPPTVPDLLQHQQGLVLVTGLAGSGKTSTLAAMLDHLNATRECHIVTIEEPVEVLHPDKMAIVDQREVGADTPSAVSALRHALRQDPDVIMVAEVNDAEVAWGMLQAAEVGHLVLAGMPTVNAVDTVQRLVELFTPEHQRQARLMLASALRGIVSQRLLPRAGGRGRVPAVEVLVGNARVSQRVADPERLLELETEMQQGDLYGMNTFDQSVVELYRNGLITRNDAVAAAREPSEMRFSLERCDFERHQGPQGNLPGAAPNAVAAAPVAPRTAPAPAPSAPPVAAN
jgi:twitching motility protein PilT